MKQLRTRTLTFLTVGSSIFFQSCANILMGVAFPNQCTQCEVYDVSSQQRVEVFEGCGASNVGIEDKAKVYAFDHASIYRCNLAVRCTYYTQPTTNSACQ